MAPIDATGSVHTFWLQDSSSGSIVGAEERSHDKAGGEGGRGKETGPRYRGGRLVISFSVLVWRMAGNSETGGQRDEGLMMVEVLGRGLGGGGGGGGM